MGEVGGTGLFVRDIGPRPVGDWVAAEGRIPLFDTIDILARDMIDI